MPNGLPESADIRDLSVTGIGLLTDRVVEPGTRLEIQLSNAARRIVKTLSAEVRHVRRAHDGRWLFGCLFERLLTTKDALGLG